MVISLWAGARGAKRPQTPEEVHKLREENKKLKAEIRELQSKLSGIGGKILGDKGKGKDIGDGTADSKGQEKGGAAMNMDFDKMTKKQIIAFQSGARQLGDAKATEKMPDNQAEFKVVGVLTTKQKEELLENLQGEILDCYQVLLQRMRL